MANEVEMERPKRPISVAIIAWLCVGSGVFLLAASPFTSSTPQTLRSPWAQVVPPIVTVVWDILGGIVGLASGLAMLKARNWGRLLYVYYTASAMMFYLVVYGFQPSYVLAFVLSVATVIPLFLPSASTYFAGGQWPWPRFLGWRVTTRKTGGIILFTLGGLALLLLAAFISLDLVLGEESPSLWAVIYGVFVLIVAMFTVQGVMLWGRRRWRMVTGTFFTSIGGAAAFLSVAGWIVIISPQTYVTPKVQAVMQPLTVGWTVSTLLFLVIGIPLIIFQIKLDRRLANSRQSGTNSNASTPGSPG